jgi:hypothetical protein
MTQEELRSCWPGPVGHGSPIFGPSRPVADVALPPAEVRPICYLGGAPMERLMRRSCAILAAILLLGVNPASAAIRIIDSIYADDVLLVTGQARPNTRVTLDGKYVTKSDGGGHFEFREHYKPQSCMSSITTDEDSYSAIITNCLLTDAEAASSQKPSQAAGAK